MEPTFDQLVRETSFAGETTATIAALTGDVRDIKTDVKHLRTTVDRWGGAIAVMSAALSVAVSLVVTLFR